MPGVLGVAPTTTRALAWLRKPDLGKTLARATD
jgi:hypothetical protein